MNISNKVVFCCFPFILACQQFRSPKYDSLSSNTGPSSSNSLNTPYDLEEAPVVIPPSTTDSEELVDQPALEFALSFLSVLSDEKNTCFSPSSIRFAFGMTYAGAKAATADQFESVFGFTSQSHQTLSKVQQQMVAESGLQIANRIFVDSNLLLEQSYKDELQSSYEASPEVLNFIESPEESREKINQWVADQTEEQITELLPPNSIKSSSKMVLVNALYFLSHWASAFSPDETNTEAVFNITEDKTMPVSMMHQKGDFKYVETAEWKVVELPYSNAYAMVILLPKVRHGLSAARQSLNAERYSEAISQLSTTKINIHVPKFTLHESVPTKEALLALGLSDAFSRELADFSLMTGGNDLYIDDVYHQATIKVDEQGTEASAATAVVMMPRGGAPKPLPVVNVDHPFLFVIHHREKKDILFLGQVFVPE